MAIGRYGALSCVAAVAASVAGVSGCGTGRVVPKPPTRAEPDAPFRIVEIRPAGGRLATQLAYAADEAAGSELRPYVELTSSWCSACHWLDRSVATRLVGQVFGGIYLVRIDVDHWEGRLGGSGLDFHSGPLPAFIALDHTGRPIGDWIDRASWGSDVPAVAAPVLADFFHWAG
jgi:hypothetical protein